MRVILHMLIIPRQNPAEVRMFGMMDGLDDKPIVAREVEERARFACSRAKESAPDFQIDTRRIQDGESVKI